MLVTTFETGLGTSFTVDVVRFLLETYPGVHFVWVMGADNLAAFLSALPPGARRPAMRRRLSLGFNYNGA